MMEYIDGLKINEIKEEDYQGFASQVMKFGFTTTFMHGVTHGDLHGGNILFIKDPSEEKYKYKIGVIDFGIIYEIDQKFKSNMLEIFLEMFNSPPELIANKVINSGIIEPVKILNNLPKEHYNNISEILTEVIREAIFSSKKANQIQIYKFFSTLKNYLNNNKISELGLRPSDDFIKTQLVLAMSHGVTLTLCKEDFMTIAEKVINELFHTDMII